MAPGNRKPARCPGELAELKQYQNDRFDGSDSESRGDIVAHLCLSLYSNDDCMVSTSDSVKGCEHKPATESLKLLLKAEHKRHEQIKPSTKSSGRRSRKTKHKSISISLGRQIRAGADRFESQFGKFEDNEEDIEHTPQSGSTSLPASPCDNEIDAAERLPTSTLDEAIGPKLAFTKTVPHAVEIGNETKVTEHMMYILKSMQQGSGKKLAKAWIKGICPKKQAKYPYHNKLNVPQFWPNVEVCPFTEPDHIKKEERLQLCLHLLRLRPGKDELQFWNDNNNAPHKTHTSHGWTAFLKEIAPPEILMDVRQTNEDNAKKRIGYLKRLYSLAELEERYKNDEVDADTMFMWNEEIDPRRRTISKAPVNNKRPHETTASASDAESEASHIRKSGKRRHTKNSPVESSLMLKEQQSDRTTIGRSCTFPSHEPAPMSTATSFANAMVASPPQFSPSSFQYGEGFQFVPCSTQPPTELYKSLGTMSRDCSLPSVSVSTSFSSNSGSFYHPSTIGSYMSDTSCAPMTAPTNIHHALAGLGIKHEPSQMCMSVTGVPEPYFDTVPNSPVVPRSNDMSAYHDLHSIHLEPTQAPWYPSSRSLMTYGHPTGTYDHPLQRTFSMPASSEAHMVSHLDGIRTLANTPVDESPVDSMPQRSLSNRFIQY